MKNKKLTDQEAVFRVALFYQSGMSYWVAVERDKPSHLFHDVERIISNPRKGVLRVDDGLEEELDAIRCVGNGVCPQQALPFFDEIVEAAKGVIIG